MATFKFRAYDSVGAKFDGEQEAPDKKQLIASLKEQGLMPAEVTEVKVEQNINLFGSGKIKLSDLEFLTAELSLLLKSGVRIDRGIDIIRKNKAKPAMAKLLEEVSKELKSGHSLSDTLRKFPDTFSDLYCNLVELGEASGNLDQVFKDLAKDLKFQNSLRKKIISSLMYPLVIFFVCILSIFFIFNFIVPRMSSMFDGATNLPWYTSALLATSDWLQNYQWTLVFIVLALVGLLRFAFKNEAVVNWWQVTSLSLPLYRTMLVTVERIRFNSGLALMLSAGLAIDKALALCIGNVSNLVLKKELRIASDKVKRGNSLADSLGQSTIYPPFLVSLLEVGEESGNLEAVFEEISDRSREEFENWTQRVTTLLEPLMIVFMGGFVGGIVIIMLLSMVSINEIGI